eukprot:scaffold294307_cov13-Prasinocladus_malaysianus.AAC.1
MRSAHGEAAYPQKEPQRRATQSHHLIDLSPGIVVYLNPRILRHVRQGRQIDSRLLAVKKLGSLTKNRPLLAKEQIGRPAIRGNGDLPYH